MGIKAVIKSNATLRNIGKKIKIYKEFGHDAKSFSNAYLECAEKRGDHRYRIMLIVHSLEKGMCMADPRPFGRTKVRELINILQSYSLEKRDEFEYCLGISILYSWKGFYEEHSWETVREYAVVKDFLNTVGHSEFITGSCNYTAPATEKDDKEFRSFLLSRHSVRDFQNRKLETQDLMFAIECFRETPTACNRQMCRLYYVNNVEVKSLLDEVLIGIPGFNKEHVNYFVITYDLAAFDYSGERNQGLFNAGLCTMNFINGLHLSGIGSCCLQWSNKHSEDVKVRQKLGLSKSERIAIVVGAGYYLENNTIPCSVRRSPEEIFTIIK